MPGVGSGWSPNELVELLPLGVDTNCSLWSLCGNSATGEWLTTADVTTEDGHQTDAELILCDHHAATLGLNTRKEETK